MLKRKQFEKCVNYLKEVEEAIISINVKYGFDNNDMIYSYASEKVKNGYKQYQFCRGRKSSDDRQWNLNIYIYSEGSNEPERTRRYFARTDEELWEKLVDAKIAKEQESQNNA